MLIYTNYILIHRKLHLYKSWQNESLTLEKPEEKGKSTEKLR